MEKEKFINTMVFKHITLAYNNDELIELLKKSDDPLGFYLDLVEDTYEIDKYFFTLNDDIPKNVLTIMGHFRFEKGNKKYIDRVNDIISNMKIAEAIPDEFRKRINNNYIEEQADTRCLNINSKYELLYLLKNDMVVYQTILDGNLNHQTLYLAEEAITYFMNSCIKLFDDENFLNNSYTIISNKRPTLNIAENRLRKTLIKEMNKLKK